MLLTRQYMLLFPSCSPSGFCNHEFKAKETIIVMLFKLVPTRALGKLQSRCSAAWSLSLDEDTVNGWSERCCAEGRGSKVMGWARPGFDAETASGWEGSLCLLLAARGYRKTHRFARDLLICCDTPVPTTCVTLSPGPLCCTTIHSLALCHTAVACPAAPPGRMASLLNYSPVIEPELSFQRAQPTLCTPPNTCSGMSAKLPGSLV